MHPLPYHLLIMNTLLHEQAFSGKHNALNVLSHTSSMSAHLTQIRLRTVMPTINSNSWTELIQLTNWMLLNNCRSITFADIILRGINDFLCGF